MKKVFSLILALCMVLTLLPVTASAATVDSGQCGNNATWTLDDEGTLTISGTGAMWDYEFTGIEGLAPWRSNVYQSMIRKIVVEPGITYIGEYAFADASSVLEELSLPDTVTRLGQGAFYSLGGIQHVTLPPYITEIPAECFWSASIETVTIPSGVTSIGRKAFSSSQLKSIQLPDNVTSP